MTVTASIIRIAGWPQSLRTLLPQITQRLDEGDCTGVQVELPRGAVITLCRIPGTRQRLVEISRPKKPLSHDGYRAWDIEIATFVAQLGLRSWKREDLSNQRQGVAVQFLEPEGSCPTR